MATVQLGTLFSFPSGFESYTTAQKINYMVSVADSLKSYVIAKCQELGFSDFNISSALTFSAWISPYYYLKGFYLKDTVNNNYFGITSSNLSRYNVDTIYFNYSLYVPLKEIDPIVNLPDGYEQSYSVDFEDYNDIKTKYDNFVKNGENNVYQAEKNFWLAYFNSKYADIKNNYSEEEFERLMNTLADRKVQDKMKEDLQLAQLNNEKVAKQEELSQNEQLKNNDIEKMELEKIKDDNEKIVEAVEYQIQQYMKENDLNLDDIEMSYSVQDGELKSLSIARFDTLTETYQEVDTASIRNKIDEQFSNNEVYTITADTSSNQSNIDLSSLEIILGNINNSISDNKLDLSGVVTQLQTVADKKEIDLTEVVSNLQLIAQKEQIDYTDSFQYFSQLQGYKEREDLRALREGTRETRELEQHTKLFSDEEEESYTNSEGQVISIKKGHYSTLKSSGYYNKVQEEKVKVRAENDVDVWQSQNTELFTPVFENLEMQTQDVSSSELSEEYKVFATINNNFIDSLEIPEEEKENFKMVIKALSPDTVVKKATTY